MSSFLMDNLSGAILGDPDLEADPVGVMMRACASVDADIVQNHPGGRSHMRPPGRNGPPPQRFDFTGNPGPGSTAIVVLLLPPRMFVANVGDSRAIVTDHDGQIIFQSVDQRPNVPEERARILRLGGVVRNVDGMVLNRKLLLRYTATNPVDRSSFTLHTAIA